MESISFFVPADIDLVKSENSSDGEEKRIIRGYASTNFKDRQDEEIVQKGLDISDFIKYGWFNYDHDSTKILGYPLAENTRITPDGFYVEGELLKGVSLADQVWEVATALKRTNSPRKLGFSVEGNVLQRGSDGRITSAKIYNVAITPNPVNPTATWDAVVKSFSGDATVSKAVAGYETPIGEENSGSSLKAESLDSAFKTLACVLGNDENAQKKLRELRESLISKAFNDNEATLYLQLCKGLSRDEALQLVNKMNGGK